MKNQDIRSEAKQAGIRLWQIADAIGITDSNFSRRLRKELPQADKIRIREIINTIKAGEANE